MMAVNETARKQPQNKLFAQKKKKKALLSFIMKRNVLVYFIRTKIRWLFIFITADTRNNNIAEDYTTIIYREKQTDRNQLMILAASKPNSMTFLSTNNYLCNFFPR